MFNPQMRLYHGLTALFSILSKRELGFWLGSAAAASGESGGAVTLRGRISCVAAARQCSPPRRKTLPLPPSRSRSLARSLRVVPVYRRVPTHPDHKDGDQTGHHLPENPAHRLLLRLLGRENLAMI